MRRRRFAAIIKKCRIPAQPRRRWVSLSLRQLDDRTTEVFGQRMKSPDDVRHLCRNGALPAAIDATRSLPTDLLRLTSLADMVPAAIVGKRMRTHREHRGLRGRATFRIPLILSTISLSLAFVEPGVAMAEGALAVGIARGGIAKGYATGFAINQPTVKAARINAVEQCKRTKRSNADARSGCEVVVTFRNKCVASAVDPRNGTPGAGWGIGGTQESADSQALARCRAKAGADRADFCEVTDRYCDGK